jgi:hypothetical protein
MHKYGEEKSDVTDEERNERGKDENVRSTN